MGDVTASEGTSAAGFPGSLAKGGPGLGRGSRAVMALTKVIPAAEPGNAFEPTEKSGADSALGDASAASVSTTARAVARPSCFVVGRMPVTDTSCPLEKILSCRAEGVCPVAFKAHPHEKLG